MFEGIILRLSEEILANWPFLTFTVATCKQFQYGEFLPITTARKSLRHRRELFTKEAEYEFIRKKSFDCSS